MLYDIY
jgi:dual specificity tyrosine-phosphorylation-regulated kinase 2/3/4